MKAKLKALLTDRERIHTEQKAMLDSVEKEGREFTAEETAKYEAMDADFERLTDEIGQTEAAIKAQNDRRASFDKKGEVLNRKSEIIEIPGSNPGPAKLENEQRGVINKLWNRWLTYGERTHYSEAETRALQADLEAQGGFLVAPEQFQLELIKAIDDMVYMRQICRQFTVARAVSLGVPTLETDPAVPVWTGEILTGNEDSSFAFGKRNLYPHPLAKRIKCSKKLLQVSLMPVEQIIRDRFAYQFSVTMENAFLTGTGVNQPLGVFTASADGIGTGQDVSTGNTTTAIKADGLIEAKYSLKSQYMAKGRWIFHRDAVKMIRKLKTGEGDYIWNSGIASDRPATILDSPYILSEFAPNTFTTGLYVGIFGDFSWYWIVDALGMSMQVLTELYATTHQNGYIARVECDGAPVLAEAFARVKLA